MLIERIDTGGLPPITTNKYSFKEVFLQGSIDLRSTLPLYAKQPV
jgi:hypothetical protein